MAIAKIYESRNIPDLPYAMFFFDESPSGCDTVAVICVMRAPDPNCEWKGYTWTIWQMDVTHAEIYDAAVDLEREEPRYDTCGTSWTCENLAEVLEDLSSYDFDGTAEMIEEVQHFFSR